MSSNSSVSFESSNVFTNLAQLIQKPLISSVSAEIIRGVLASSIKIESAASIIAKVTRDRIMREWDNVYPQYGFASHKGYGTAKHILAIKEYGPCPLHRKSFIKNFI